MPTGIANRIIQKENDACWFTGRNAASQRRAKLALRREAREEIEAGLLDRDAGDAESEAKHRLIDFVITVGPASGTGWRPGSDRDQYDFLHLSRAAGLTEAQRDRLKDGLFGPKCDYCGFRDCAGSCREYEFEDYYDRYDFEDYWD